MPEILEQLLDALDVPPKCENILMPPDLPKQEAGLSSGKLEWKARWEGTCGPAWFYFMADRLCEGEQGKCRDDANTLAALVVDVEKFYNDLLLDPGYQDFVCDPGTGNDEALCMKQGYQPPKDISMNVVMVPTGDKDAGAGSGGPGSAKVFIEPIPQDQWIGVDDVHVIAHELHHAHGSCTEFDPGSELAAIAYYLSRGNRFNTKEVDKWIAQVAWGAVMCFPEYKRACDIDRKMVKFLYSKWPDQVKASLRRSNWSEQDLKDFDELIRSW